MRSYDQDKQEWLTAAHGDKVMRRQPRGNTTPAEINQAWRNITVLLLGSRPKDTTFSNVPKRVSLSDKGFPSLEFLNN